MKVIEFIIDSEGELVFPALLPVSNINAMNNPPTDNQISLIFYDTISMDPSNGVIIPSDPVTTGLSGTVTLQGRISVDSAWSNIEDGALDLSTGANMAFPAGLIYQVQALCTTVTGCNYILVRMDRGA